jgi:hypothetical protein
MTNPTAPYAPDAYDYASAPELRPLHVAMLLDVQMKRQQAAEITAQANEMFAQVREHLHSLYAVPEGGQVMSDFTISRPAPAETPSLPATPAESGDAATPSADQPHDAAA